jgi:RsiW-degrading membrane proteinase PrsW (M82 family)
MFASLWGYPIGLAIRAKRSTSPAIAKGLGAAVLVHGVYDFLVFGMVLWTRLLAAALILAVWMWRMHLIERVLPSKPTAAQGGAS